MTDPIPNRADADELDDDQLETVAGGAAIDWSAPDLWPNPEDARTGRPGLSTESPW